MFVGLDFGTTNTSAALFDGSKLQFVPLDPANTNSNILRSALFVTRPALEGNNQSAYYVGREAINRFVEGNMGREINYELKYVGSVQNTFGSGTVSQALYAQIDTNTPGRLFLSLKTALRDLHFTHTVVFGKEYSLEQLLAVMLRLIVERIETHFGQPVEGLVIGRPVHYATDPSADAKALERMQKACTTAGLPPVNFLEEPTAAALSFAYTATASQKVLVFDFGGGTLDVTIMQLDGQGSRTFLATDGVPVGGDLIDQCLMMGRLLPHFGLGATIASTGSKRLPLTTSILDHLIDWQSIVELTQPHYMKIIDEAIRYGDKPKELQALRTLVTQNYGLTMYEVIEGVKVRLSDNTEADLALRMNGIDIQERVPRWDFERLIGPKVREVEQCVDRALRMAQLQPSDIDVVLRTGGSSRIPRFVRMLADKFGSAKLQEMDVFTGVAAGLAIAAWEQSSK